MDRRTFLRAMGGVAAAGLAGVEPAPAARPFRMGVTPWPSEMSLHGLRVSADFIARHADLVEVAIMGGLPWEEALLGKPYSPDVQRQLAYRPPVGHQLLVYLSPLDTQRRGLAPHWGERDNMPLPAPWARRRFNSPEVIQALGNFALSIVDAMRPDYLAIGVESNVLLSRDRAAWLDYKEMHRAVYQRVKRRAPRLPVFFSTEINHYLGRATEAKGTAQEAEVADLMRSSDLFAMSYYPHMSYDTRWPIPNDAFDFARRFRKPIAVAETGMLSKPVTVAGIPLRGSEADQRQYYEALLRIAERDRYRFVVTFAGTDYDRLLTAIQPAATRELASIWVYTGLQTADLRPKPALAVWDRCLARPVAP